MSDGNRPTGSNGTPVIGMHTQNVQEHTKSIYIPSVYVYRRENHGPSQRMTDFFSSSGQRLKHNASFMSRLSTRTRKDPVLGGGHVTSHHHNNVLSPINARSAMSRRDKVGHGCTPISPSSMSTLDSADSNSLDLDRCVRACVCVSDRLSVGPGR